MSVESPLMSGDSVASVPSRERLPDVRESVTHKFEIDGHEGYITIGLYPDGRPGELFIKMAQTGSTISGLMDTIGVLTSLTLQHGIIVDTLARKFEYTRFPPSGFTRNEEIRRAHSVVDYIFRWLGLRFSDQYRVDHPTADQQGGPDDVEA